MVTKHGVPCVISCVPDVTCHPRRHTSICEEEQSKIQDACNLAWKKLKSHNSHTQGTQSGHKQTKQALCCNEISKEISQIIIYLKKGVNLLLGFCSANRR